MIDEPIALPHKLTLCDRNHLTMTGVSEVISFDDTTVILRTSLGTLIIQGQEMQLRQLSPDGGQVTIDGTVTSFSYEEPRREGFFHRLLG